MHSPHAAPPFTIRHADVECRWMHAADLREVLSLERASFEFPWTRTEFDMYLDRPLMSRCLVATRCRTCEILGYLVAIRRGCVTPLESLCVREDCRRQGIGRFLVQHLIGLSRAALLRPTLIATHVRETNLPAQLFFRAMGFRAVETHRCYWEQCNGSAYRFEFPVV